MNKNELRKKLLEARKNLDDTELDRLTKIVRQNLINYLSDKQFETVHCFEPIESLSELDIIGLFDEHKIFTSRKIDGKWQIVPIKGYKQMPKQFDLIIVPMLGFDITLNRIGYGGGYYDKFLVTQPGALKVGVCLEQGKVKKLPTEPHDVPLDIIISDSNKYQRL